MTLIFKGTPLIQCPSAVFPPLRVKHFKLPFYFRAQRTEKKQMNQLFLHHIPTRIPLIFSPEYTQKKVESANMTWFVLMVSVLLPWSLRATEIATATQFVPAGGKHTFNPVVAPAGETVLSQINVHSFTNSEQECYSSNGTIILTGAGETKILTFWIFLNVTQYTPISSQTTGPLTATFEAAEECAQTVYLSFNFYPLGTDTTEQSVLVTSEMGPTKFAMSLVDNFRFVTHLTVTMVSPCEGDANHIAMTLDESPASGDANLSKKGDSFVVQVGRFIAGDLSGEVVRSGGVDLECTVVLNVTAALVSSSVPSTTVPDTSAPYTMVPGLPSGSTPDNTKLYTILGVLGGLSALAVIAACSYRHFYTRRRTYVDVDGSLRKC